MNFLFEGLIHGVNLLKEGSWIVKGKRRTGNGGRRTGDGGRRTEGRRRRSVGGSGFPYCRYFLARISLFLGTDLPDYTVFGFFKIQAPKLLMRTIPSKEESIFIPLVSFPFQEVL